MFLKHLLRSWTAAPKTPRRRKPTCRPTLEWLEDRRVPTVFVWDGAGTDNNWLTATNWHLDGTATKQAPNGAVVDLRFPTGVPADSQAMINNLGSGIPINSLRFEFGGYSVSQDAITLGAGGITATGGLNTLNTPITLSGTAADLVLFDIQGGPTVTVQLAGRVSGAAGLDKTGTGRLSLQAVNGYSGKTLVQAGTLFVHTGSTGGESPLGGTAGVTEVKAAGILALTGTTSYTILNETLLLEGTLSNPNTQNYVWKGNLTLNGDATLNAGIAGFSLAIDGVISGASGNDLTKVGPGTVTFKGNNANTYTGATHVNEGTLALNKPSGVTSIPGDLFVGDGTGAADSDRVVLLPQNTAGTGNNQIDLSSNKTVFIADSGLLDLNGNTEVVGTLEMTGGHVTTGTGVFSVADAVIAHAASTTATIDGHMKLIRPSTIGDTPFTIEQGSAGLELVVNADLRININGAVFGVVKLGPGTMQLNAANTYDGQTRVQEGILEITHAGALGVVDTQVAGNVLLANTVVQTGGELQIKQGNASFAIDEELTLQNGGTLDVDSSANATVVTWTGNIRLEGTGNSITGTESTAEFVLTGRMNGPGDVILKELTIGGTVDNSNSGLVAILGDVKFSKPAGIDAVGEGASIVIDDAGPTAPFDDLILTASNQIPDEVPVTIALGGTLDLNNFNETITTLILAGGQVQTGTGTLTLLGTVTSSGQSSIDGKLKLDGISTQQDFTVTSGKLDVDAVVSGIRGIEKHGAGEMVLSAANLYGGFTEIVEGILTIENGNALSPSSPSNLNITTIALGSSLRLAGGDYTVNEIIQSQGNGFNDQGAIINAASQDHTLAVEVNLVSDTKIGGNGTLTISGRIHGGSAANPSDLTFSGSGTFILAGTEANIYTGNTILNAGTLVLNKSANVDAVPATQLIIGDGTGADIVRLDNSGQIPNPTEVVVNSSGRLDYNDEFDQIGLLTLNGGRAEGTTGTLTLNNNIGAAVTNNQVPTINGNIGLTSGNHNFTVADAAGVVNDMVINGQISGTGGVTKLGQGRLEYQGSTDNTYTGQTKVHEGTLSLNKPGGAESGGIAIAGQLFVGDDFGADIVLYQDDDQVADNRNVTVASAGRFDLNNHSDRINTLTMSSGVVSSGTGVLTVSGNIAVGAFINTPATILGNLSWPASLVIQVASGKPANELVLGANLLGSGLVRFDGPGTALLTGNSLNLDTISIGSASTVLVNGTHGGNVTLLQTLDANSNPLVNTIGGTGTVNGNVTVSRSMRLSPGDNNGPETLNVLGSVAFASSNSNPAAPLSALVVEVDGLAGPGVAGGHDQLIVNGGVTLGTNSELRIDLGFEPTVDLQGTNFLIVKNESNLQVSGQFVNAPDSLTDDDSLSDVTISVGGKEFFVDYGAVDGNDIALVYHAGQNEATPVLTPIGNREVNEGGTLSFTAQATDADNDQLTFRLAEGAPVGASIDPITGQFTFAATDGPSDDPVVVTVIVSDNGFPAFEAAETFLIAVNNVLPTLNAGPDGSLAPGGTFLSQGTIQDVTADLVSATVNFGDGTGDQPLTINEDGSFNLNHQYLSAGLFTVTVTGSDDDGGQVIDTAQVRVTAPVVTPPVIVPPTPKGPISAVLASVGTGRKKKLVVRVQFSGGLPSREIVSPFQKPNFLGVTAALKDVNGDGIFDSIVFTGRRGGRKVIRTMAL